MAAKTTTAKAKAGKAAPAGQGKDGAAASSSNAQEKASDKLATGALDKSDDTDAGDEHEPEKTNAESQAAGPADTNGADDRNGAGAGAVSERHGVGADAAAAAGSSLDGSGPGSATGDGSHGPDGVAAAAPAGDAEGVTAATGTVSAKDVKAPTGESAKASTRKGAKAPTASLTDDSPETAQTPPVEAAAAPVILGSGRVWSMPEIRDFPALLDLTNHTASRFVVRGERIEAGDSIQIEVTEQQYLKLEKTLRGHARLDQWDNVRGVQVGHANQD